MSIAESSKYNLKHVYRGRYSKADTIVYILFGNSYSTEKKIDIKKVLSS